MSMNLILYMLNLVFPRELLGPLISLIHTHARTHARTHTHAHTHTHTHTHTTHTQHTHARTHAHAHTHTHTHTHTHIYIHTVIGVFWKVIYVQSYCTYTSLTAGTHMV